MDNYREVELLAKKNVGDSGTETIDINVDEPITELTVRFKVTNDPEVCDMVPPESCVSKIELVDGGQVYASLSGREATAMAWYDKGYWPHHNYSAEVSEGQYVEWPFQFGRYVGDEEFAFSPSKLLNPQLKITWAINTLHLASSAYLDVNAKTLQGVAPPSKALLTKVIRSWNTGDAGIEEVDLPTNHPYRRLYFRAYKSIGWLGGIWTNFRLECDVGKLIVFDMDDEELYALMARLWGPVTYQEYIKADYWEMHQTHLGFCTTANVQSMAETHFAGASATLPGYVRQFPRTGAHVAGNDIKCNCQFGGIAPEYTYCYPFGRADDVASWFNVARYGSIKLKITEGTADCAGSVFVQQPIPLP